MEKLFTPLKIGSLELRNRMVMAPMTRSRADANGVPSPLAVEYYMQRAGSGLIITEGTQPSESGKGYPRTPGVFTPGQIAGWKAITDAVHSEGGRIFLQIMHVGRIAHAGNRLIPDVPVAPSAIRAETTKMWTDSQGMQDLPTPRALGISEIPGVIDEYRVATKNALEAGFDGVELHAASGYLPMQFLSSGANQRTDEYGGSAGNRIRFTVEALKAMIAAAGDSHRVGIKIAPEMKFNDISDANPLETYTALAKALDTLDLAYVHVMRTGSATDYVKLVKDSVKTPVFAGGGFNAETGEALLESGGADAIVYGTLYISNPDLTERFKTGAELAKPDQATFYTPGAKGYADYPALAAKPG
jgi:N-ethylmaleimide reductase